MEIIPHEKCRANRKDTVYMEGNVTKDVNTLYTLRKLKDRMKDTGPSSKRRSLYMQGTSKKFVHTAYTEEKDVGNKE